MIYQRCGVLRTTARFDNPVAGVFIGRMGNGSPAIIAHGKSRPSELSFAFGDARIYVLHTMRAGWRSKGDLRGNERKRDEEQGKKASHDRTGQDERV